MANLVAIKFSAKGTRNVNTEEDNDTRANTEHFSDCSSCRQSETKFVPSVGVWIARFTLSLAPFRSASEI